MTESTENRAITRFQTCGYSNKIGILNILQFYHNFLFDYIFNSMSTPAGSVKFVKASITLGLGLKISINLL